MKIDEKLLPEINIGMIGHVAHGKCLCLDEFIFVNNEIVNGVYLFKKFCKKLRREKFVQKNFKTVSLTKNLRVKPRIANLFFQKYRGKILRIETVSGRSVKITPNHPLLVLENKCLKWKKAEEIKKGERIAVLNKIDLIKKNIDLENKKIEINNKHLLNKTILSLLASGKDFKIKKIDENLFKLKVRKNYENSEVKFEKIKKVDELEYDGIIYDLTVPHTHNFFGGLGFILLHNTMLTYALTKKLTLQHSEELKRGITIKLGYADATFYKCKDCGFYFSNQDYCPSCLSKNIQILRTVSFIDAPGHETLMATVITATPLMEGAILVIAANQKCPQPQTKEHLKAIEIAGVKNVIIVQNKIDLVDKERILENYEEIKKFIKGTSIENVPIIPISAQFSVNIDKVIEAIQEFIPTPKRKIDESPRMYVVRSFDVNKPGTKIENLKGGVLGGSVIQGRFKVGDEIEIKPGMIRKGKIEPIYTKIISLQKAGYNLEEAGPGGLVGLMTNLDPYLTKGDRLAGTVVGLINELPENSNEIQVEIHLLEKIIGFEKEMKIEKLKIGEKFLLNVATQKTLGIVKNIKREIVEFQLSLPIVVEEGQRIVISRQVEGRWRLIGYGIVK